MLNLSSDLYTVREIIISCLLSYILCIWLKPLMVLLSYQIKKLFLLTVIFIPQCAPRKSLKNKEQIIEREFSFVKSIFLLFIFANIYSSVCTLEELAESLSCPGYKAFGWCDISDPIILAFMRENCNLTCGICQRKLKIRFSIQHIPCKWFGHFFR